MEFQVVLERDETSRHYTATVPGMSIVVDATTKRRAIQLAREAIGIFLEETGGQLPPSIRAELVKVDVDAIVA